MGVLSVQHPKRDLLHANTGINSLCRLERYLEGGNVSANPLCTVEFFLFLQDTFYKSYRIGRGDGSIGKVFAMQVQRPKFGSPGSMLSSKN